MRTALFPILALSLAACATTAGGAGEEPTASAVLRDAAGKTVGTARLADTEAGVRVSLNASGLPAGPKGFHVHTVGKCEAPKFESAGGHWNPTAKQHGFDNPAGAHGGDLRNLDVAADGTGRLEGVLAGARLRDGAAPLLDADGATLMIHAGADDYRTDPSGNSGGRVACGVVEGR